MERNALRGLSREELVELVLRLQELVGTVAQLEARVAELESPSDRSRRERAEERLSEAGRLASLALRAEHQLREYAPRPAGSVRLGSGR